MNAERKNIRIVDIAKMAKVSAGTVDRVLHERGKVSKDKREKVEKVLREINYEPNIIARSLASKRQYTVLLVIPFFQKGDYWDSLNEGVIRVSKELANYNVKVEYVHFDQDNVESFKQILKVLDNKEFDGLVIATLFKDIVVELSTVLDTKEIPYVYIDSDITGQNNLAYFGSNSFDSGAVAARLMMSEVGKDADILIAHIQTRKNQISTQMDNREKGFREYLAKNDYRGKIHVIDYLENDYTHSLKYVDGIMSEDRLLGVVSFNSRIHQIASVLHQHLHLSKQLRLIGYDTIEKNLQSLKTGDVSYLLSQRSDMQGYNSIKALSNYLLLRKKVDKTNYMPIDILMKENIDYYYNYKL